jgi:hypothetical protein
MECKKQILMVNPDNRLTWLKGHNYYQVVQPGQEQQAVFELDVISRADIRFRQRPFFSVSQFLLLGRGLSSLKQ